MFSPEHPKRSAANRFYEALAPEACLHLCFCLLALAEATSGYLGMELLRNLNLIFTCLPHRRCRIQARCQIIVYYRVLLSLATHDATMLILTL